MFYSTKNSQYNNNVITIIKCYCLKILLVIKKFTNNNKIVNLVHTISYIIKVTL